MRKSRERSLLFPFMEGRMKVISHDLGNFEEIVILPLADWHIGDPASDGKRITEWLDYLKRTPNAFAILNGDLMNCAIRNSISDVYTDLSPMEQLKQCVKLFEPIKEKLLAVNPGNHELRIYRNDGLDLTQIMCDQLCIGDRYSPASTLLFVRFGKWKTAGRHGEPVRYSIYCVHGSGAGRTEGAKVNRLMQLASIVDADVYIHSHLHTPAIVKTSFFRTSPRNGTVEQIDKLYVNTGAALQYQGYGELASFKPASTDTPLIRLNGHRRGMTAEL